MSYRIRTTVGSEADIERVYASLVIRRGEEAAQEWYLSYSEAVRATRQIAVATSEG